MDVCSVLITLSDPSVSSLAIWDTCYVDQLRGTEKFLNLSKMITLEHVLPTKPGLVKRPIVSPSSVKLSIHLPMVIWYAQRNATLVRFVLSTVILVSTWSDPVNVPVVQRVDGQVFHQAVN